MKNRARVCHGFTLVEVLAALLIMALLALMSYRGIGQSVAARARVQGEMQQTRELVLALVQLETDINQRLPEVAWGAQSNLSAPLPRALEVRVQESSGLSLTILRGNLGERGEMLAQRVTYTVEQGVLVRYASAPAAHWPVTDTPDRLAFELCAQKLSARVNVSGVWYALPLDPGVRTAPATGLEIVVECDAERRFVKVMSL